MANMGTDNCGETLNSTTKAKKGTPKAPPTGLKMDRNKPPMPPQSPKGKMATTK